MTQDNKDAALELANVLEIINYSINKDDLITYYNAARYPLEEENARFRRLSGIAAEFDAAPDDAEFEPTHPIFMMAQENDDLRQQLLATQEAYQRVVEALKAVDEYLTPRVSNHGVTGRTVILPKVKEALANPPSLEAVERKKLEDEIAALKEARDNIDWPEDLNEMIAERQSKLEKMNEIRG